MLILWLALAAILLRGSHARALLGFFSGNTTLDFPPTQLTWPDRVLLLLVGAGKTLLTTVGYHHLMQDDEGLFDLPLLELSCPVKLGLEDTQRYEQAVKGSAGPFLLAAVTNPLMLLLVVHPRFPVAPLGAVNVRNRFEFLREYSGDTFTANAAVGGQQRGRRTKRGIEFDVTVTVQDSSGPVLRQVITLMKSLPSPAKSAHTAPDQGDPPKWEPLGDLRFQTNDPDRWARLCGDYNPIHMSSILARLFGLPGRIAHGNHAVACVLPLLRSDELTSQPWYLEAEFRRPMVLPVTLNVECGNHAPIAWRCAGKNDKTFVTGSLGALT